MARIIEVVPYNSQWPQIFEAEAKLIKKALGDNCIAIHHIGSTAIPGLSAKPVIDILPVVKSLIDVDKSVEAMEQIGYEALGEYGIPLRRFFQKGGDMRTHHVHVFEKGNPLILQHLKFRDWLISHPDDAKAYQELKLKLASKFSNDSESYVKGKEIFIQSIETKIEKNSSLS
jgi:GrpB-like predicted nucleotidyltransferase (UPF0157 family)